MEETRTINVSEDAEQNETEVWQDFGWSLMGTQAVHVVDNHLERKGDEVYQISNRKSYIRLTFKRYTNMPEYLKIKEYERQYHSLKTEKKKGKAFAIFLLVLAFLFAFGAIFTGYYLLIPAAVCAFFAVVCAFFGIFLIVRASNANAKISAHNSEVITERMRLRQLSRALLL